MGAAESWAGLTEEAICEAIVKGRPDWKRIVGMLPPEVGPTRAIVAAAIESGSFSDKDLIIATPTLEELGLLEVQEVKARWDRARAAATDTRAAHIARNVTTKAAADALVETAEKALQKEVAEVVRGLHVFVIVDRSGSMESSLESAKTYLSKFVHAFPLDHLHVTAFNSVGREVKIPHASAAGVASAFKGLRAEGGTDYGQGVKSIAHHKYIGQNVGDGATEDNLFIFVGDEEANEFSKAVRESGLNPVAFGLLKVPGQNGMGYTCVQQTANILGIPCFLLQPTTFDDAFAIPRTLRTLIQATPVGQAPQNVHPAQRRKTLIELILATPLLAPPDWA